MDGFELLAVDAVEALSAVASGGDEADLFEDAEVLGDHGLGPAEAADEFGDGHFAGGEGFEDLAAFGLGDGVEGVEGGGGVCSASSMAWVREGSR